MRDYKPNEIIVNKACQFWAGMLSNPKFDALGNDPESRRIDDPHGSMVMAQILGSMNAEANAATQEQLEAFKVALKKYLIDKTRYGKSENNEPELVFADKYPDKVEYRIVVALLQARLAGYCGEVKP